MNFYCLNKFRKKYGSFVQYILLGDIYIYVVIHIIIFEECEMEELEERKKAVTQPCKTSARNALYFLIAFIHTYTNAQP